MLVCVYLTGRPTWKVVGIRRRMAGSTSCGLFVAPITITCNHRNHSVNTSWWQNYQLHFILKHSTHTMWKGTIYVRPNTFPNTVPTSYLIWSVHYRVRASSGCVTWVVEEVSMPSHRLMNWAFIMAVASWSRLERFLRNDSNIKDERTRMKKEMTRNAWEPTENRVISVWAISWGWNRIKMICLYISLKMPL